MLTDAGNNYFISKFVRIRRCLPNQFEGFVKGNFYIKIAKERIKNFNLRTPNCTICNVFDPNNNIVNTQIISIGDINDEIN